MISDLIWLPSSLCSLCTSLYDELDEWIDSTSQPSQQICRAHSSESRVQFSCIAPLLRVDFELTRFLEQHDQQSAAAK